jgi:hypothetical protein
VLIRGLLYDDLLAAANEASQQIGNRLELYGVRREGLRADAWRLRLRVADLDKPGARLHYSHHLGYRQSPLRSRHACAHACGAFFCAVFKRNPQAFVRSSFTIYRGVGNSFVTYRGVESFLRAFPDILEANVGSPRYPIRLGDSCTCKSDELVTDSLRPELWRMGEPGIPTVESVNRKEEVTKR